MKILLFIPFLVFIFSSDSNARPEIIKTGIYYYADEYVEEKGVNDIGEEKNYEEVYKNYEYFETQYDDNKRVKLFRQYKRGEIVWEEKYSYNPDGTPSEKIVKKDGKKTETIKLNP